MRPKPIIWAERLFLAAILLVLIGTALTWSRASAALGAGSGAMLVAVVLGVGLPVLALLWATRRHSRIARWLLVAWALFSAWAVSRQVLDAASLDIGAAATVAETLLMAVAVVLLFAPGARGWFARGPAGEAGEPRA